MQPPAYKEGRSLAAAVLFVAPRALLAGVVAEQLADVLPDRRQPVEPNGDGFLTIRAQREQASVEDAGELRKAAASGRRGAAAPGRRRRAGP